MNTYKASCSIEAACWYLANAAMRAGDDPIADSLREIIKELQAIDPDFHAGSRVRTAPQQPKRVRVAAVKKDKTATVALLQKLREQNPKVTNRQLGLMAFDHGHHARNGHPFSASSIFQILKSSRQEQQNADDKHFSEPTESQWTRTDIS